MMSSQNIRIFIFAALVFIGMMLYNHWEEEHKINTSESTVSKTEKSETPFNKDIPDISKERTPLTGNKEIPETKKSDAAKTQAVQQSSIPASIPGQAQQQNQLITVKTNVLNLSIDPQGGDIVYINLPQYPEGDEPNQRKPYVLMDRSASRFYIAQSGLTGEDGPDSKTLGRAKYTSEQKEYVLAANQDRMVVDLHTKTSSNVDITKRFVFYRDNYTIDVEYLLENNSNKEYKGSLYARLKRKPEEEKSFGFLGIQTYTGAAVHTKETPYKKISFKDMVEKPFTAEVTGGWAAMVEHYFLGAWIPTPGIPYEYQTVHFDDGSDAIGFVAPAAIVKPGAQDNIEFRLYAGPQITETLKTLAPGLELSVDYGILWPICQPIFWLLKEINEWIGNWGWSIVIITILIKLLFYNLSAKSYRSLGNMRKLQPKIEALKERYGDDKQRFSQAVMELYKKEKVNPLGGCLPVLIQIPVFIALYYVLLGSVELRHAPFILWIQDLSAKDPYYVLPILMGLSMLVQQKLNPPPPDPVQAKVMMVMPIVFTVLFLNFPAGLVLYWFVNNVLSIAQQWVITQRITRSSSASHGVS